MKPDTFIRPTLQVSSYRDWNGRHFHAWRPNVSQWFGDTKTLLKWLAWPAKTPTGDELREWLRELEERDAKRADQRTAQAPSSPEPVDLEGGFGPECHLDETDPNFQTRVVT